MDDKGGIGGTGHATLSRAPQGDIVFPEFERLKKDLQQQFVPVKPEQLLKVIEIVEQLLRAHYGR